MIYSSEMTRKRVKYVKKVVKEGREEVLRVLRVDTQQGYIDLSKKAVKTEEIEDFKEHYLKGKTVHGIMKLLSYNTKVELERLYPMVCWPLYKLYNHAHDGFKDILK
jgi:translation initiation factor 2 subunit 1